MDTNQDEPRNANIYSCIENIAKNHEAKKNRENVKRILDRLNSGNLIDEANQNREGETALHMAIRCFHFKRPEEKKVVRLLISKLPNLMVQDRRNSKYDGQTPLHMAVCKGNSWLVETLLNELSKENNNKYKKKVLETKAHGAIFTNTVMMGELPLTIAALTFNKEIFDMLFRHGANLDGTNTLGDNICHSLTRYAHLYPDKRTDVLAMCRKINDDPSPYDITPEANKSRKLKKKVWLMENRDGLNPLQLAASLGQHEIFTFIMDLEAYCFENSKDGLFDIKIYDVTEIDAISSMKAAAITGVNETLGGSSVPENIPKKKTVHIKHTTVSKIYPHGLV